MTATHACTAKRLSALILALAMSVLSLSFASCSKKGEYDPPTGWQLASDEAADFYFYVPDNWTVDYSTAAAGAYYSASDPSSVSVMAWELPNTDTSLDDWWEMNREELEKVFTNFNLESEENFTLTPDNLYAKRYVYTAELGGYSYRYMQAAALKGTAVYLFTYCSVEENYESHLEAVEDMLGFFIIK
ncbi:MAG: hypothetical protein E7576_03385 [Ruminococcaceae bacterium]|jgi:hypothetical protein|nr:hypothetical protein [Oscillospiraceae bacterium]